MSTKTILFSTEMVRAILEGRKTVTRRAIKPQPKSRLTYVCMGHKCGSWSYPGADAWKYWEDESFRLPDGLADEDKNRRWTPPCHTDDILYVRETCQKVKFGTGPWHWEYRADVEDGSRFSDGSFAEWRPSIHMPREAARIFLRVTNVRVERLQDIARDGAVREGANPACAVLNFKAIWDSTIKKPADRAVYGWAANPWVWVIEFEWISKEASDDQ